MTRFRNIGRPTVNQRKHFRLQSPLRDRWGDRHQMRDAGSGTDLCPFTKFQPNPSSSFGVAVTQDSGPNDC